jgi:hypothetical protein
VPALLTQSVDVVLLREQLRSTAYSEKSNYNLAFSVGRSECRVLGDRDIAQPSVGERWSPIVKRITGRHLRNLPRAVVCARCRPWMADGRDECQFLAAPRGSALSAEKIEGIGNLEAACPNINLR